jgi:TatD DNase family protein
VKAYNEIIGMYNKLQPPVPWILHGYAGNPGITSQLVRGNILFSFGEILFKREAKAIDSFRDLPPERIYLETDESERDIREIYERASEIKKISIGQLKHEIWKNFNRIENISFPYPV